MPNFFYVLGFIMLCHFKILTILDHIHSDDDYLSVLEGAWHSACRNSSCDSFSSFPLPLDCGYAARRGSRETVLELLA